MLMYMDRQYRDFIRSAKKTLVSVYKDSLEKTPADTAALLIDQISQDSAEKIVALMIVAKGDWDARISRANREWADGILGHDTGDLAAAGIFYCDDIHPAHMDQIADELRKMKKEG